MNDYAKTFEYFNIGANSSIDTLCEWNIYNLVKYFYLNGNSYLGIQQDLNKSIKLLKIINHFEPAQELLLECYYQKYLMNKSKKNLNKVKEYLDILNNTLDSKKKKEISNTLNDIYNEMINIKL